MHVHASALLLRSAATAAILHASAAVHAQDFNGNGSYDALDLRNGVAPDCNHNGIPDAADTGLGRFMAAVEHRNDVATLTNVNAVAFADVDLDGDRDVLVAARSGTNDSSITVWRNDGGPGLTAAARYTVTGALCWTLRVADLDGDGRLDIVSGDAGFAQVIVMRGTGPGTFGPVARLTATSRGTGLALADLDGDGDLDIVFPGAATNTVDVFRSNGNGTFAPRTSYACGQQPSAAAVGDFTGDGLPDIAVTNSYISWPGQGTVTLLRNTGKGGFTGFATLTVDGHPETSINSTPHDVCIRDIDGDGDGDLLVSSKDSNSLRIYTNDGAGAFANTQTLGPLQVSGGQAERFACTDLDGDPAPELAWCDTLGRTVRIYDNVAGVFVQTGSFAAGTEGPSDIAVGDLDADGVLDLCTAGNTSSSFSVLRGSGALGFHAVHHFNRSDMAFYPMLCDFTGDGLDDLASYSTFDAPSSLRIAPGLGGGRFGPALVVPLPSSGKMYPRDLDADGDLDILSLGNSGNWFSMLNTGSGTFAPPVFPPAIQINGNFQTADIDGNGTLDALWTNSISSNQPHFIRWSPGDGNGGFGAYRELVTLPFLGSVWTGDLNGDGAPELFAGFGSAAPFGGLNEEKFLVYPNIGGGDFGVPIEYSSDLAPSVAAGAGTFGFADLDGDGDGDLTVVANGVWLFRNNSGTLAPPVAVGGFANYAINEFGPAIRDADADGDLDFIGAASIASQLHATIFFNDGNGGFGGASSGPRSSVMRYRATADAIALGDADANGRPDILLKPSGYSDWYLHLNLASSDGDCTGNGIPDRCDIASGGAADADGNGVPDECEPPACPPGDVNCDGSADAVDLALVLQRWGSADAAADLTRDGTVDARDVAEVLSNWSVRGP
jgi:hypothetical protein